MSKIHNRKKKTVSGNLSYYFKVTSLRLNSCSVKCICNWLDDTDKQLPEDLLFMILLMKVEDRTTQVKFKNMGAVH